MMNKVLFIIFAIIASIPLAIGLILTCILCIVPFSIRGKSIKIGIKDSIGMFNDVKSLLI